MTTMTNEHAVAISGFLQSQLADTLGGASFAPSPSPYNDDVVGGDDDYIVVATCDNRPMCVLFDADDEQELHLVDVSGNRLVLRGGGWEFGSPEAHKNGS
jgi:hypothetical protein